MRSVLLGTGGRVILVIKWQGTWLNLVCVYCVWKIELVIEETRYLAGEISKQHVQPAWFYLEDFGKMWEERNYLKTKLWLKREAEFEDFENCQPICIEENRKDWERNRCVAIWPFEKEINQPSQQKPGVIEKNNGRIIPKAIQRLSELSPIMSPECRGPLVPSVDLGHPAWHSLTLQAPAPSLHHCLPWLPSLWLQWAGMIEAELWENDCSHQDFKGQSFLAHAWAQDSNPRELRDQGKNCYPTTQTMGAGLPTSGYGRQNSHSRGPGGQSI